MENDTNVQTPTEAETAEVAQPEQQSSSPTTSEGGSEDTKITTPNSGEGQIDPKEYARLKSEEGRLKQVREQLNQIKNQYDTVTTWVAKDANRMKDALINTSGYTEEQADAYIKQYYKDRSSLTTEGQQTQQAQQTYVDPLDQLADQEMKRDYRKKAMDRRDVNLKFLQENQTSDNPLPAYKLDLLFTLAGTLESEENLTPEQSLREAKDRLYNKNKLIKDAREEGELQGLATASGVGSSIVSGSLGTQPRVKNEPFVSDDEWKIAQELGAFKDKTEYVLYRDNPQIGVG